MKKKLILLTALTLAVTSIMIGCSNNDSKSTEIDVVSSASQAPDEKTFEEKISKDGNFIIITSKDLTFDKDLTVDGTFTKKDSDGNEVATRSLALAEYGENNSVIRYTLTVPRIVINSENTLLEYGIIKGDVYVQAPGFKTKDATIDGNLYFANQELKDAFSADELTKVTGEIEVKEYTK
ncbi:MAG: hypothetical protein EWM47_01005 [Anaerolineaceae bacterium]|nr:MAG: hypothetical protein EWM47_01005 [Anaerolineaceae bacterium]